jgi:hypothetical protein
MRKEFNVDSWAAEMRFGIDSRDADTLARLMYENDRNGCFSYEDVCAEFGDMARDAWIDGTVECARKMLSGLIDHVTTTTSGAI